MLTSDAELMQNVHATHCLAPKRIGKERMPVKLFPEKQTNQIKYGEKMFHTLQPLLTQHDRVQYARKRHLLHPFSNFFCTSLGILFQGLCKTLDDFFPSFSPDLLLEALQFLLAGFAFALVTFFDFFKFLGCFFFEFDFALAFGFGLSFTTVEFAFFSGPCNNLSNFSAAAITEGTSEAVTAVVGDTVCESCESWKDLNAQYTKTYKTSQTHAT